MIQLKKGESLETICKARLIAGYEFELQRRIHFEMCLVRANPVHEYFKRYDKAYMDRLKAAAWEKLP